MTDKYAVIGNPVKHSKSPEIHAAFAAQTGEDIEYGRILGDMEDFAGDVHDFVRHGGKGLNVTLPFKEDAFELVDECSKRAGHAGAVNTILVLDDGRLRGDNTDGIGLVRDLTQNHGFDLHGKRILLIGAGGASRGILLPLLEQNPHEVVIANRTESKAVDLADIFSGQGSVTGCALDKEHHEPFDLIINGTSAGIRGEVPQIVSGCLRPGGWTYDMMYGDEPTAFVKWGLGQGASKALDGLGMLVEQAAESFFLWRGVRPETAPVIRMLRS
jgi:shikimate dehydrogenase